MSTVRLLGPDQAPLLARPYYEGGQPDPITAALAHVPELMTAALPFIGAALGPSALSWRTKELVIVRVSALMECRFCVHAHTAHRGNPDANDQMRGPENFRKVIEAVPRLVRRGVRVRIATTVESIEDAELETVSRLGTFVLGGGWDPGRQSR